MQQASDRVVTDSVQIVEGADGVQMDLLAETVENGKVPEPGATAEYTEVSMRRRQTPLRYKVSQSCSTFPVLSVGVDAVGPSLRHTTTPASSFSQTLTRPHRTTC